MYGQPGYYPSPTTQMAQQRLQAMEAQYPQFSGQAQMGYSQPVPYQNWQQPAAPATPALKGRPVSNEEEANAAMIDFDGSLFVFPDKAHGKIYTKQLGLDGNIVFLKYTLEQPATEPKQGPQVQTEEYVKKSELDERLAQVYSAISSITTNQPPLKPSKEAK